MKNLLIGLLFIIMMVIGLVNEPVKDSLDLIAGATSDTYQTEIDAVAGATESGEESSPSVPSWD